MFGKNRPSLPLDVTNNKIKRMNASALILFSYIRS